VTAIADVVLEALPSRLPVVTRRAATPAGFRAGGVAIGIKTSGRPDLALVASTVGPVPAAAVFTPNRFAAAPVRLSRSNLAATSPGSEGRYGYASAVVSTSGSANAATGAAGDADQHEIARAVADALGGPMEQVLTLSTGVIGTRLPLDRVLPGVAALAGSLTPDAAGLEAAAAALMTTDSRLKVATVSIALPGPDHSATRPVTVSGIAKGVGMIHPRMATMLSVVLTDAACSPALLSSMLRRATARTWDQLTVDGDTSTNDTVFVLASGAAGAAEVTAGTPEAGMLADAIEAVARDLARQQAADGEGATTLITCQVSGAGDDAEARAVARAVVASSLVKAAVHGRDPNWGRIAGAAGNATLADEAVLEAAGLSAGDARSRAGQAAVVDPDRLRIAIAGQVVFEGALGGPRSFDREAARTAMDAPEVLIRLDLGLGEGTGEAFGCDLTETYVIENSEYTT
jgi:glutamate N-acetyltransferase/amino-acid N-acetyltransferase